jgi:hypothetical protein
MGIVRQNGNAIVAADTELGRLNRYDWDGSAESSNTVVRPGVTFRILASAIDDPGDGFDAEILLENESILEVFTDGTGWMQEGTLRLENATVRGEEIENPNLIRGHGTVEADICNRGVVWGLAPSGPIVFTGDARNDGGFRNAHVDGLVEVGCSIGTGEFRDVDSASGATLIMELGGLNPGVDHDQATMEGEIEIDGSSLDLVFVNGFAPRAGQTFDLISLQGSIAGGFDAVNIINLAPGFQYNTDFDDGVYRLTALNDGVFVGTGGRELWAGDADRDLEFDQLDLVQVQIAAKYLTGEPATWGEDDWDGAPGGSQAAPPVGNGVFDQLDVIAALAPGHYLSGSYAEFGFGGEFGDRQTSIIYDPRTGELGVDAPASTELTSINIDSAAGIFTNEPAQNMGGSFDNDSDWNLFKATFGSSFPVRTKSPHAKISTR